jgi:meso-butanediol dehydrogenase/(S,S)-butanediol dehydrogenase/diacetyl reductase
MALDGKTALVTGAGGGIGQATAIELAKAGADVAVADLNLDAANETSAKIESLGRRGLLGTTVGEMGSIDIVVNNAGVMRTMRQAMDFVDQE